MKESQCTQHTSRPNSKHWIVDTDTHMKTLNAFNTQAPSFKMHNAHNIRQKNIDNMRKERHIIHGQWSVIEIECEEKPSKKINNWFNKNQH
jgi:hypothetical protein